MSDKTFSESARTTPHKADRSDIAVGSGIFVLATAALWWIGQKYAAGSDASFLYLCGLVGGGAGWIVGILISPYSDSERRSFSEYPKWCRASSPGSPSADRSDVGTRHDVVGDHHRTSSCPSSLLPGVLLPCGVIHVRFTHVLGWSEICSGRRHVKVPVSEEFAIVGFVPVLAPAITGAVMWVCDELTKRKSATTTAEQTMRPISPRDGSGDR